MIKTNPANINQKISLTVQTWLQIQITSEKEVRQQLIHGFLQIDTSDVCSITNAAEDVP